ncbi:MAG: aldehyde dehydrogenase family protein [Verrucomicrobiota bacterium]
MLIGDGATVGQRLLDDKRVPLISATGSSKMGVRVAECVGRRFGKTILELGGNNAIIVAPSADMDLAARAILVRRGRHSRPTLHHARAVSSFTNRIRDVLVTPVGRSL